jgi:hypothetical protein
MPVAGGEFMSIDALMVKSVKVRRRTAELSAATWVSPPGYIASALSRL